MIPREPDDFLMDYVDPNFGAAIADVISTWARFEYALDELIWDLAGLEPEAGARITTQYTTVANRFNSLGALARLQDCDEQFIRKLNKLKDRALGIADKRNRVAHDPWFRAYEKKEHYRLQKTSKGKLEFV